MRYIYKAINTFCAKKNRPITWPFTERFESKLEETNKTWNKTLEVSFSVLSAYPMEIPSNGKAQRSIYRMFRCFTTLHFNVLMICNIELEMKKVSRKYVDFYWSIYAYT